MRYALMVAKGLHAATRWLAARSWRLRELLVAAGFDEARLRVEAFERPEGVGKPDNGRVEPSSRRGKSVLSEVRRVDS